MDNTKFKHLRKGINL